MTFRNYPLRVSEDIYLKVDERAKSLNMSLSEYVRQFITLELDSELLLDDLIKNLSEADKTPSLIAFDLYKEFLERIEDFDKKEKKIQEIKKDFDEIKKSLLIEIKSLIVKDDVNKKDLEALKNSITALKSKLINTPKK